MAPVMDGGMPRGWPLKDDALRQVQDAVRLHGAARLAREAKVARVTVNRAAKGLPMTELVATSILDAARRLGQEMGDGKDRGKGDRAAR